MKKNSQIVLRILLILISYSAFSQLNYTVVESTGQIKNVDHYVIKYKRAYIYDMDFNERSSEIINYDFKISFNLDASGRGELVTYSESYGKLYLTITQCVEKTYKDSLDKYWQFDVVSDNGYKDSYFLNFQNNVIDEFWFSHKNNERTYFTN